MKIPFHGIEIEISDWSNKLKITTIIFGFITIISCILTLFFKITIPGLSPIAFGLTMLLLGIKQFNIYFKEYTNKTYLILGIISTVLFGFLLYIGTNQLITALSKSIGL